MKIHLKEGNTSLAVYEEPEIFYFMHLQVVLRIDTELDINMVIFLHR